MIKPGGVLAVDGDVLFGEVAAPEKPTHLALEQFQKFFNSEACVFDYAMEGSLGEFFGVHWYRY
jgi:hypothetical protein